MTKDVYCTRLRSELLNMNSSELREYASQHNIHMSVDDYDKMVDAITEASFYRAQKAEWEHDLDDQLIAMNIHQLCKYAEEHDVKVYSRNPTAVRNSIVWKLGDRQFKGKWEMVCSVCGCDVDTGSPVGEKATDESDIMGPTALRKHAMDQFETERLMSEENVKLIKVEAILRVRSGMATSEVLDAIKVNVSADIIEVGKSCRELTKEQFEEEKSKLVTALSENGMIPGEVKQSESAAVRAFAAAGIMSGEK